MNSGNLHCSYTCTYRYGPGDRREGWRRRVNSGNLHCTHIHTGTDLRTCTYRYGPGDSREGGGEV